MVIAACGAFTSEPAAATDGGADTPDAAAEASAVDSGSKDETCEILFTDDFTTLGAFDPQSNDAGPATLSKDPAHAVNAPSLAAMGKLARGGGYLNSSASRDVMLPAAFAIGQRVELEYELFIENPVDTYAEVGCTLQMFDAQGVRTRLLLGLPANAAIEATYDPPDAAAKSLTRTVFATRGAGDYRVKTTLAATSARTANLHYEVRTETADFTDAPIQAGIDRLRLVCGIDYAISVVVRRCIPKP